MAWCPSMTMLVIVLFQTHPLIRQRTEGCPFQLRNRMKLNFAVSDGQPKRRAAPNLPHHSCVMAVMALGSFDFCH